MTVRDVLLSPTRDPPLLTYADAVLVPRFIGESLVLLHNTGGVTQAFSSLRKGILSSMPPPDNDHDLH